MASYKERVQADLDRWIAGGLVSPDKRAAILATLPETGRIDAATALAWIGAVLLGVAAIAFIGANWDVLPRLARFALVLAVFAGFACAGAWATQKGKPLLSNITLTIAALVFAAGVGLTGQIFDIAGDPQVAAYIAGVAGFALALAGRSTGAAAVGLVFIALGDLAGEHVLGVLFHTNESAAPWMVVGAPLGAWLALRWRSAPLAHLSALGIIYVFFWFAFRRDGDTALLFFFSVVMAGLAAAARWLYLQDRPFAGVFYGWFAWGAFLFFIPAGYTNIIGGANTTYGIAHRVVWLAASGGLIALGRFDRHMLVSFVGVLGMIGAICALMMDFGLDLMAAAGVFLLCAVVALIAGLALRRKPKAT